MADPGALDFSCTDDLDPNFRPISGGEAVAQAVYRELVTPLGKYWWDATRGLGIWKYANSTMPPGGEGAIAGEIEACSLNDDRVSNASASVNFAGGTLTVSLSLTLTTGATVELDVAISQLTSTMLYKGTT